MGIINQYENEKRNKGDERPEQADGKGRSEGYSV